MLNHFLNEVDGEDFDRANRYVSEELRKGAFVTELTAFGEMEKSLNQEKTLDYVVVSAPAGDADSALATIRFQNSKQEVFDIPLRLEQRSGDWVIASPGDPERAQGYFKSGHALLGGSPDAAVRAYRTGLVYNPLDADGHADLGKAFLLLAEIKAGDSLMSAIGSAATECKIALDLDAKDAKAYLCLGQAELISRNPDTAIKACGLALELNLEPKSVPFAQMCLGFAYRELGGTENNVTAAWHLLQACWNADADPAACEEGSRLALEGCDLKPAANQECVQAASEFFHDCGPAFPMNELCYLAGTKVEEACNVRGVTVEGPSLWACVHLIFRDEKQH